MEDIDRRSALAFGFATAATLPVLFTPTPASAQRYHPDEGREIAPGVRRIDLTKRASEIPAYATVSMRDMVCHCLEGELHVSQEPGNQFVAKTGDVWSCKKGMAEANENKGSAIAIMRVIDLIPPA
jgi:hypothetical protein